MRFLPFEFLKRNQENILEKMKNRKKEKKKKYFALEIHILRAGYYAISTENNNFGMMKITKGSLLSKTCPYESIGDIYIINWRHRPFIIFSILIIYFICRERFVYNKKMVFIPEQRLHINEKRLFVKWLIHNIRNSHSWCFTVRKFLESSQKWCPTIENAPNIIDIIFNSCVVKTAFNVG